MPSIEIVDNTISEGNDSADLLMTKQIYLNETVRLRLRISHATKIRKEKKSGNAENMSGMFIVLQPI